jgi:hypothetical protein
MIEIFTIIYNEEIILQKFINHYRERFPNCEITIYDNMSTDNSRQIAVENNCKIIDYNSNNEIRDDLYLEIKNNCWKKANTSWVLIADADEFLDINQEQLQKEDCSIILSKGYNMVNLEDDLIFENIKFGIRAKQYDKYYLFNKSKIKEINYEAGCHSANPKGEIKFSKNVYNLFHYTMLSEQYLIDRYRRNYERLSSINKKYGWGIQYTENEQIIKNRFNQAKKWFSENKQFNSEQAINIKMIKHNYQSIEGWFNMEKQYLELLDATPEKGIFVELGAYKGKSTSFIVTEIVNRNRNIQFYTVDTFEGDSGSTDKKEVEAYKQVNVSKMYEEFKENTKHLENKFTIMVNYSYEAADYFLDNSVDQIFIDAGHSYEAVIKDIQAWYPKMKNGSIIAGHDYNSWEGVKKAVNELLGTPDKVENDCWFIKIEK